MVNSIRKSVLTIFCAYAGFVVAGMAFYAMVDDSPFVPLMHTHGALRVSWTIVVAGSVVALLAVSIGGLPIALAVLREAFGTRRRDLMWLLSVPLIAVAVLAAWVLFIGALANGWIPSPFGRVVIASGTSAPPLPRGSMIVGALNLALVVVAVIVSAAALCIVVTRSTLGEQRWNAGGITLVIALEPFALRAAVVATLAMGLMLAATTVWGLLAWIDAPQAFRDAEGVAHARASSSWLAIVTLMALATGVAVRSLRRGWSGRASANTMR